MHFLNRKNVSAPLFIRMVYAAALLLVSVQVFSNDLNPPEFDMSPEVSTKSGYQRLDWAEEYESENVIFKLQQSQNKDFENAKLLYEGKDRAKFVSGLTNGTYYYRVRAIKGDQKSGWSQVLTLQVNHHSLYLALSLAALGVVVFLLTVYIIIHGVREQKKTT